MKNLVNRIRIHSIREIVHKSYQSGISGIRHRSGTEYELIYVDYGHLTLELDGGSFFLGKGKGIVISPDSVHCLQNQGKYDMHFFNIMFTADLPSELCSRVLDVDENCHSLMMELRKESREMAPGYEVICRNDLLHFMICLLRKGQSVSSGAGTSSLESFRTPRAKKIYEKVSNSYRSIRFDELAASSGVSRSELYLIFRDEIGSGFRQVVSRFKLEQAQYLLQRGDLTLAEIASEVGCEQPSLFRMFKKMTGMTPGEYARSLGTPSRNGPDPDPGLLVRGEKYDKITVQE